MFLMARRYIMYIGILLVDNRVLECLHYPYHHLHLPIAHFYPRVGIAIDESVIVKACKHSRPFPVLLRIRRRGCQRHCE